MQQFQPQTLLWLPQPRQLRRTLLLPHQVWQHSQIPLTACCKDAVLTCHKCGYLNISMPQLMSSCAAVQLPCRGIRAQHLQRYADLPCMPSRQATPHILQASTEQQIHSLGQH